MTADTDSIKVMALFRLEKWQDCFDRALTVGEADQEMATNV